MNTRFITLLAMQMAAIIVLIAMIIVMKPNQAGLITIISSIVLVTVVTLTGIVILTAIETARQRLSSQITDDSSNVTSV